MDSFVQQLKSSLWKGFIDRENHESELYKPELLVNNSKTKENVLSTLLHELEGCTSFFFSVAFITESGLATLKAVLLDLHQKGVKGRILTSTFLQFNQPKMFKELQKLKNVEVRLTESSGFHSKGYIFKHPTHYSFIVGSSNLTAHALKVNYEWNVKLTSHREGDLIQHFSEQFEEMWDRANPLSADWIHAYEKKYIETEAVQLLQQVIQYPTATYDTNNMEEALKIQPNKMQLEALLELDQVRKSSDKALIISATGTGKTFLSAFDVRSVGPKRVLFIVHREQILQKAKQDFRKILGGYETDYGIFSGNSRNLDAKYVFATIQSISKEETLRGIHPDTFDYIIIDEVHKAGTTSYLNVMKHFTPTFLLGMTATPERTDGFNIYELFDYQVAYEIRLQKALEEDMLCPFHYYGVTDLTIDGHLLDESENIHRLSSENRVQHILEKLDYYSYAGSKVRGLIFCSRKQEAAELSSKLNSYGLKTAFLSGEHSQEIRSSRVEALERGELDYLLTVDIFNEGIDIPSVNQVVMLRQTESSIIFIQQLGRGLRKHPSKEFVTVIDFIGNYRKNYLIPIALSGDQSLNKDNVRRTMVEMDYLSGTTTVHFEAVAKEKIYESLNNVKLTNLTMLKEAYTSLKNRIGRIPYVKDFIQNQSIDPVAIMESNDNYYTFLTRLREKMEPISKEINDSLTFISQELINGKRSHELLLLKLLLEENKVTMAKYTQQLKQLNLQVDKATVDSVERILSLAFYTKSAKKKYGSKSLITLQESGEYTLNLTMQNSLEKFLLEDAVNAGLIRGELYENNRPLTIGQKYSRKDACRLLNWDNDEQSTMYGYKPKHGTCPIFVTYKKNEDFSSSMAYEDSFKDPKTLHWYSKTQRTLNSPDVKKIVNSEKESIAIHVFVQKNNSEGYDFYYLGRARVDLNSIEQTKKLNQSNKLQDVVTMDLLLEKEVEPKLYRYLTES